MLTPLSNRSKHCFVWWSGVFKRGEQCIHIPISQLQDVLLANDIAGLLCNCFSNQFGLRSARELNSLFELRSKFVGKSNSDSSVFR